MYLSIYLSIYVCMCVTCACTYVCKMCMCLFRYMYKPEGTNMNGYLCLCVDCAAQCRQSQGSLFSGHMVQGVQVTMLEAFKGWGRPNCMWEYTCICVYACIMSTSTKKMHMHLLIYIHTNTHREWNLPSYRSSIKHENLVGYIGLTFASTSGKDRRYQRLCDKPCSPFQSATLARDGGRCPQRMPGACRALAVGGGVALTGCVLEYMGVILLQCDFIFAGAGLDGMPPRYLRYGPHNRTLGPRDNKRGSSCSAGRTQFLWRLRCSAGLREVGQRSFKSKKALHA